MLSTCGNPPLFLVIFSTSDISRNLLHIYNSHQFEWSVWSEVYCWHVDCCQHLCPSKTDRECQTFFVIMASSEFVSSSVPSWQILTARAQPFRGARDLAFCLKVPLDSLLVWASSEGSGETGQMHRLAWTFAARIGDKYQIRLTQSIWLYKENIHLICWSPTGASWHMLCMLSHFFLRLCSPEKKTANKKPC